LQLDDVIGQAQAVSSSLGEQRSIFSNIGNKLVGVSSKFPMVNGVMNAIRRKKNKVQYTAP
jgi:Golgi SNAP receptor complex protein 1